jgi:UPF0755 protein
MTVRRTITLRRAAGATLGLGAFALGALFGPALWPGPAVVDSERVFEVPAHAGLLTVARSLEDAGIIRSRAAFVGLSLVRGSARRLRAGEYEASRGASTFDVLALVESGRVVQHPILHPEGATVVELGRALEAAGLARAEDVVGAAQDPQVLRALSVDAPSLEGYLFPDTYYFVRGLTPEEMLSRMVQRLRAKLTPERESRARGRGLSTHQLLTLAAIVEREAIAPEERTTIAAVFWNRLRRDMPLQADPTVQYAVGKERRALSRADLQVDHPFNTYRRSGLPPGPIASPGLAAIDAVLEPAVVPYLYFVAMDDRHHQFSTTLEEHNAAVARYRLTRRAENGAPRP